MRAGVLCLSSIEDISTLYIIVFGILVSFFIVLLPLALCARCIVALFSSKIRQQIRRHKWLHALWMLESFFAVTSLLSAGGPTPILARRMMAGNQMNQVQVAIIAYENDYGAPPDGKTNAEIMKALMGNNRHGIEYIELNSNSVNAQGEVIDPWGTPFRISMANPQHPLLWSAGPDKVWGTVDDIRDNP